MYQFVLTFLTLLAAQDRGIEARANANPIGIEDTLELIVSLDAPRVENGPALPKIDGLTPAGTAVKISGGRPTYFFMFSPQKVGLYEIGPFVVWLDGKEHRTEPIELKVVAGTVSPPSYRPAGPDSDKKIINAQRDKQPISIQTMLTRNKVAVDEPFRLIVEIEGVPLAGPPSLDLGLPDRIRETSRSSSTQSSLMDGKVTDRTTVTYHLVAESAGLFEIDSIVLEHQGKSYRAKPLSVEVVQP